MPSKYLIVSLGSIGKRHLGNLRILRPDAQVGVLRLTPAGATEGLPESVDIQFRTINEAIEFRPDAAIIASPASTHLSIAMSLIQAGIPLLIEKPLATSSAGLSELFSASAGIPIMVAYNLRFLPSLIETRRIVLSGAIGHVLGVRAEVGQYLPDWRPDVRYQNSVSAQQALGGGALLELSHEIDYIYWMFGVPVRVSAVGGRYGALEIDVEDMVSLCFEYEKPSFLVNIHLDFLQRSAVRTCKFIGSEGTLVWDGIAESIALYCSNTRQWSRSELPSVPDKNTMYIDELSQFLAAVEGRCDVGIDALQGWQVLRIVEAAKESITTGMAVKVA